MDDFDVIETPENVNLQRRLAGIGSRTLAGLLDHLVIAGLYLGLVLLAFGLGVDLVALGSDAADGANAIMAAVLVLISFLIYWGYFFLLEMWMNGQTVGKRYMKIRVVQQEGGAVAFHALAIRNLLRAVDFLGVYAVGGITMFFTRKAQRLGDLAAGTIVVSEELPNYVAKSDSKRNLVDDVPVTAAALKTTHLSPREYRLLHNYWLRRDQLTLEARYRLLHQLLGPILSRSGTEPTDQSFTALEAHIETLMKQSAPANASEPTAPEGSA